MARQPESDVIDKALSRRIFVNIKRDALTILSKVIWQHEQPILEAIHGEGNIEPAPAAGLDEGFSKRAANDMRPFNKTQNDFVRPSESQGIGFIFVGDPKAEFARLIEVYGRHVEENISNAEFVYGRFSTGRFQQLIGKPSIEDLPEQQLRALIRDYGYLQVVSYEADEAEKEAESKKAARLQAAPKAELLKLAAEVGVMLEA